MPIENMVKSQSSLRPNDNAASPTRFCVQTRNCFVVRMVKVTDRKIVHSAINTEYSGTSTPTEYSRSFPQDPNALQKAHKTILDAVRDKNPAVFISFQAQLPAISAECPSISVDPVNQQTKVPNQHFHCFDRGVRLAFSCQLMGNGLKIEDFYDGPIAPLLSSWERSSQRPGFLLEVMSGLKKTVDFMLELLRSNGFSSVIPEHDYTFYPFTLQTFVGGSGTLGSSSNQSEVTTTGTILPNPQGLSPSVPVLLYSGNPVFQVANSSISSPISIPAAKNGNLPYRRTSAIPMSQGIPLQNSNFLTSIANASRPLSAYGSYGDGSPIDKLNRKIWDRQISFSAGEYGSPIHNMSECSAFEAQIQDLRQGSNYASSVNSISHAESSEICADRVYGGGPSIAISASPNSTWLSRRASPFFPTLEEGDADSASQSFLNVTATNCLPVRKASTASAVLPNKENDLINVIINEVADRLRQSPHLPLIVMPTMAPGAPPVIYQLPSPDVIFVGLPATITPYGREKPRIITSPAASSAFVVTSKLAVNNAAGVRPVNYTAERTESSRFTVTSPHPGCILGVSAEGDLYEFKLS